MLHKLKDDGIKVVRYSSTYRDQWNEFTYNASNGLFLFHRDYLEYHQHRFQDFSLLFFQARKLIAIIPLNAAGTVIASHAGLTYGGLIISKRIKSIAFLKIFDALLVFLRAHGFTTLEYKPIPFVFHRQVALDDQYALFLHKARLLTRNLSSFIDLQSAVHLTKGRKWSLKKAQQAPWELKESQDYATFMTLVQEILQTKYHVSPTHTAAELNYLADKFPQNIKLIGVYQAEILLGGCVIYLSDQVVHLQYIAITPLGKTQHALDWIIHYLVQTYRSTKKYLNFGISPGKDTYGLNAGLIKNKESFGALSLPSDIYEIKI